MRPIRLVALVAFCLLLPGVAQAASWNVPVQSLPFKIPRIWVTANDPAKAPGYIFITPRARKGQQTGPTILDADGKVVWFHPLSRSRTAIGLNRQVYRGKPVLTWGQRPPVGPGNGDEVFGGSARTVYNVIADQSYRIIARVRARGSGVNTDLHEFKITSRNTALVLGFRQVRRDLSRYGGPKRGTILDSIVQEIDIKSGRVLLNWSAASRLSPSGSYVKAPATTAWDPFHVNSISLDSDGNLLLTARHLSQVIKVDRQTGKVLWKFGGKDSDFKVAPDASFYYPHDANRAPDGTITLFDNRSTFVDRSRGYSQALSLNVDTQNKTVTLANRYAHPAGKVRATSQGNVTMLENRNVFVGWGSSPWFSEYAQDGRLLFAARTRSQINQTYRAFKSDWVARPTTKPAVAARTSGGRTAVYATWNGATAVTQWRVLAGSATVATAPKTDFETKMVIAGTPRTVRVEALDAAGAVLATSATVKPRQR